MSTIQTFLDMLRTRQRPAVIPYDFQGLTQGASVRSNEYRNQPGAAIIVTQISGVAMLQNTLGSSLPGTLLPDEGDTLSTANTVPSVGVLSLNLRMGDAVRLIEQDIGVSWPTLVGRRGQPQVLSTAIVLAGNGSTSWQISSLGGHTATIRGQIVLHGFFLPIDLVPAELRGPSAGLGN